MELNDKVNVHVDGGRRDHGDNTALLALLMSDRGRGRRDDGDCCESIPFKTATLQGIQHLLADVPRTALETQIATLREINSSKDFLAAQAERNTREIISEVRRNEERAADRRERELLHQLQSEREEHRLSLLNGQFARQRAEIVNIGGTVAGSGNQSSIQV